MNKIDTINERLKYLRKNLLKISQVDFAKKVRLSQNMIARLENNTRNMSDRTISDICNEFSLNEEWLRNGVEPIFIELPQETFEKLVNEYRLDNTSAKIVKEFINLDETKRDLILDFARKVFEEEQENQIEISEELTPTLKKYNSLDDNAKNEVDALVSNLVMEKEFKENNRILKNAIKEGENIKIFNKKTNFNTKKSI